MSQHDDLLYSTLKQCSARCILRSIDEAPGPSARAASAPWRARGGDGTRAHITDRRHQPTICTYSIARHLLIDLFPSCPPPPVCPYTRFLISHTKGRQLGPSRAHRHTTPPQRRTPLFGKVPHSTSQNRTLCPPARVQMVPRHELLLRWENTQRVPGEEGRGGGGRNGPVGKCPEVWAAKGSIIHLREGKLLARCQVRHLRRHAQIAAATPFVFRCGPEMVTTDLPGHLSITAPLSPAPSAPRGRTNDVFFFLHIKIDQDSMKLHINTVLY